MEMLVPAGPVHLVARLHRLDADGRPEVLFDQRLLESTRHGEPPGRLTLDLPRENAASLEVLPRAANEWCGPSVPIELVGGGWYSLPATRRSGVWALSLSALPPGRYQIGREPDCVQTVALEASEHRRIRLQDTCAIDCRDLFPDYLPGDAR